MTKPQLETLLKKFETDEVLSCFSNEVKSAGIAKWHMELCDKVMEEYVEQSVEEARVPVKKIVRRTVKKNAKENAKDPEIN